jgi:hypothetical protein
MGVFFINIFYVVVYVSPEEGSSMLQKCNVLFRVFLCQVDFFFFFVNASEISHIQSLLKMYVTIKHPANTVPFNRPRQLSHTSVSIFHS